MKRPDPINNALKSANPVIVNYVAEMEAENRNRPVRAVLTRG